LVIGRGRQLRRPSLLAWRQVLVRGGVSYRRQSVPSYVQAAMLLASRSRPCPAVPVGAVPIWSRRPNANTLARTHENHWGMMAWRAPPTSGGTSFRAVAPVLGIVQVGLIGHARLRQRRGGPLSTSIPGPLFGALRQCFVILGNPEHHFLVHCVSDRDEQLSIEVYPRKRTNSGRLGRSALCHNRLSPQHQPRSESCKRREPSSSCKAISSLTSCSISIAGWIMVQ
jgi:hypothetical protein